MAEKAEILAKAQDPRQKCLNICKRKSGYNSSGSLADRVLQLQRTAGNQAVKRLIKSGVIKAKLDINEPRDIYEQKADRVADQVMRMPDPVLQRQCKPEEKEEKTIQTNPLVDGISSPVQPQVDEKEEEELKEKTLMKKETTETTHRPCAPSIVNDVLQSPGQSLDNDIRAYFEPRFGYDFSNIRVHTNAKAAESAKAVNAKAYTVGKNIVFGEGMYVPGRSDSVKLVAHELVHIVQQQGELNNEALQRDDGAGEAGNSPQY